MKAFWRERGPALQELLEGAEVPDTPLSLRLPLRDQGYVTARYRA